ncbi:MAG: hypothetical protein ACRD98_10490 [Nitrososphaera sp.]
MKRLGRNGMWNAISLIDENGSFRGEAKFETKKEADEYLAVYMRRMEIRMGGSSEPPQVKVFDDRPEEPPPIKRTKTKKSKKRKKVK